MHGIAKPAGALLLVCARVGRLRAATMCSSGAAGSRIEVERKFEAPEEGMTRAVLAAGGTLLGVRRICDAYWDTAECDLTRTDSWLRMRRIESADGQWELKLPVSARGSNDCLLRLG